jgi:hypothetical protein
MSAAALPPTAPTTLVILLGASAWPNSPGFQASEAFVHAAQGFKDFALDPQGFGLPAVNLFDLFDAQTSASDQLEMLGSFLEQRAQTLKAANQAVRDVLVYFVGHGGFAGPSADFYLLHRRANASSLRATGIAIDALAEVLREKARQARRYLFLDCCFAAAAFRAFQGGPDQTAITKTMDAFQVQARSSGFPGKGTVLLCSSDQKSPSLLLPDESCTMFSHALLDVLRKGDPHRPRQLSLRDIKELAEDRLASWPEKNAPRPGLHSPDQSEGDVADIPFFPNFSWRQERYSPLQSPPSPSQQPTILGRRSDSQYIPQTQEYPTPSASIPTASNSPIVVPAIPPAQQARSLPSYSSLAPTHDVDTGNNPNQAQFTRLSLGKRIFFVLGTIIGSIFLLTGSIMAAAGGSTLHLFPAGIANVFFGLILFFSILQYITTKREFSRKTKIKNIIGVCIGTGAILCGILFISISNANDNVLVDSASGGSNAGIFIVIIGIISLILNIRRMIQSH